MADPLFEFGLDAFKFIVTGLVYIAILINIFTRKGNDQIYFIVTLVGYFYISSVINDFFLATTLVSMWFILVGTKFFFPREMLLGILLIMAFVGYSNPVFFLLALVVYLLTITNFLSSSFKRLKGAKAG